MACLDLHGNNLDAAAAWWLCRGQWTGLETLNLDDNCLDNEAMQHLAQGQWDCLHWLSLLQNTFDVDGLDSLTMGEWPITCLYLSKSFGSAATWRILDLDPHFLPEVVANVGQWGEVVEQGSKSFWEPLPGKLLEVFFVCLLMELSNRTTLCDVLVIVITLQTCQQDACAVQLVRPSQCICCCITVCMHKVQFEMMLVSM